jgi:hypothetical protein
MDPRAGDDYDGVVSVELNSTGVEATATLILSVMELPSIFAPVEVKLRWS